AERSDVAHGQREALTPRGVACSGSVSDQHDAVAIRVIGPFISALEGGQRAVGRRAVEDLGGHPRADRLFHEAWHVLLALETQAGFDATAKVTAHASAALRERQSGLMYEGVDDDDPGIFADRRVLDRKSVV